jgi:hypothetical protein
VGAEQGTSPRDDGDQADEDQDQDDQPERGDPPAAAGEGDGGHTQQHPENDGDDSPAEPAERTGLVSGQRRAGLGVLPCWWHPDMLPAASVAGTT